MHLLNQTLNNFSGHVADLPISQMLAVSLNTDIFSSSFDEQENKKNKIIINFKM